MNLLGVHEMGKYRCLHSINGLAMAQSSVPQTGHVPVAIRNRDRESSSHENLQPFKCRVCSLLVYVYSEDPCGEAFIPF